MNKAILIGFLGGDPENRYTPSGTAVSTFSMATTERYTDREGLRQQKTEWHRIVAWGKLAEIVGEYLKKGSQVCIEGKIQTRDWEDKNGVKRYTTEIVARNLEMLGGGKREERPPRQEPDGEPRDASGTYGPDEEDDIPF